MRLVNITESQNPPGTDFTVSLDKIDILRNNKSYTFDFLHTNPPLLILSPLNIMYFMYENICPSHRWQR